MRATEECERVRKEWGFALGMLIFFGDKARLVSGFEKRKGLFYDTSWGQGLMDGGGEG